MKQWIFPNNIENIVWISYTCEWQNMFDAKDVPSNTDSELTHT